jgi:hypothetical protein
VLGTTITDWDRNREVPAESVPDPQKGFASSRRDVAARVERRRRIAIAMAIVVVVVVAIG